VKQFLKYPVTYLERIKERGNGGERIYPHPGQSHATKKIQPSSIFEKHPAWGDKRMGWESQPHMHQKIV
jgi:hypothetical protein